MNERFARIAGFVGLAGLVGLASACGGGISVRHFQSSHLGNLSNRMLSVAIGPRGNAWVGTDNGLARREGGAVITWWKSWAVTAATVAKPNIGYFGVSLLTEAGNTKQRDQQARVYQAKSRDGQIVETQMGQVFLRDRVNAVVYTKSGKLLAALRDRGVLLHDAETDKLQEWVSLAALGAAPTSMAEAPDGSIWVGTMGGGLHQVKDGKIVATYTPRNSGLRGDGAVRSVAVHPTLGVLAATAQLLPGGKADDTGMQPSRGMGVSVFNGGKWTAITAAPGKLASDDVTRVAVSSSGAVWFAMKGGTGTSIMVSENAWLHPNVASIHANDVAAYGNMGWVVTNNGATLVTY